MPTILDTLVTRLVFQGDLTQLQRIDRQVDRFKVGLNTAARGFTAAGAAFAAATGAILRGTMDTDRAMNQLAARTGASTAQLQRFKDQAYDIGSGLPLNTADIIEAQTSMIQLGNTMGETYDALPAIANTAVASGESIADVARWATVAKNTFNVTGDEMSNFLNVMLKAETILPATMRGMGEGLQFSSQTAKDAGLSWQEYMATLGMLGGAGREVEAASQGLQMVLTNLGRGATGGLRGGELIKKAFGVLNIGIEEVKRSMDIEAGGGGFIEVLELIQSSVGDMTQSKNRAKLTAFMAALGGATYAPAMQYLVQNTDQLRGKVEILTGAYADNSEHIRQTKERMKGASGAWDSFLAQIDTLNNKLADAGLGQAFEGLLRGASDWIERAHSADTSTLTLVSRVLAFGSSLLVVGGALKVAAILIGPLWAGSKMLGAVMLWLSRVTGVAAAAQWIWNGALAWGSKVALGTRIGLAALAAWETITRLLRGAAAAQWLLNVAMLASPIGLIVAGIAVLGAAIAGLVVYWDEVTGAVKKAWDWTRKMLGLEPEGGKPEQVRKAEERVEEVEREVRTTELEVDAAEAEVVRAEGRVELERLMGRTDTDTYRDAVAAHSAAQEALEGAKAKAQVAAANAADAEIALAQRQAAWEASAEQYDQYRDPIEDDIEKLEGLLKRSRSPRQKAARKKVEEMGGRDAVKARIDALKGEAQAFDDAQAAGFVLEGEAEVAPPGTAPVDDPGTAPVDDPGTVGFEQPPDPAAAEVAGIDPLPVAAMDALTVDDPELVAAVQPSLPVAPPVATAESAGRGVSGAPTLEQYISHVGISIDGSNLDSKEIAESVTRELRDQGKLATEAFDGPIDA